jgi:gamma-glutamyl-gamma-aminobutyrate hydrolase PuuD
MKKKIIGLVPTIIKRRGSLSFVIETKTFKFLKSCFKNYDYIILNDKMNNIKLDLIISLGGNNLISIEQNNANSMRSRLDNYYLRLAIKKKIPFLGICYGAQFIANFFKSKVTKKNNHSNKIHKITLISNKKIFVNSYHNYSVIALGEPLSKIANSDDGSIEAFRHINKRILGIMWHPERYNKIKKFDLDFIKKFL